jgi:voltage-gated potassium channel
VNTPNPGHVPFLSDRRIEQINRAVLSGRIVPYLAGITATIVLGAALVVWLFARGEFHSFGESVWWAAQTVTTVGYGDVIPQTSFSKFVAVIVMIFGITTVSLTTAVVTSALMASTQRRFTSRDELSDEHLRALNRIEARLESLERKLS